MKSSLLPRLAAWKSPPRYRTGIVSPCFLTNICPVLVFQERKEIQVWGRLLLAPGCWSSHDGTEATCSQIRSSHISAEECTRKQMAVRFSFKYQFQSVLSLCSKFLFTLLFIGHLASSVQRLPLVERERDRERVLAVYHKGRNEFQQKGYELRIRKQAYTKVVKYHIITTLLWDEFCPLCCSLVCTCLLQC